ncbi:MAG: hypothetical protein SFY67_02560 [Candidatus Melainabacteria bacterium]|nr:hypothetical protein [Candidatus Melainabacteria bacterium]
MRWLYIPDEDDPDFIAKQETIAHIEKWWQDFEKIVVTKWIKSVDKSAEAALEVADYSDFTDVVRESLHAINPNIMWEFHNKPNDYHEFVCTVEDNYSDGAVVQTMVRMSPKLEGWRILTHRPPVEFDALQIYLQQTAGLEIPQDIRVSWTKSHINRIMLGYHSSHFTNDLSKDLTLLLKLTSAVLGEEMFEKWIDRVAPLKPVSIPVRMLNQLIGKENPISFQLNVLLEQCNKIKNQILNSLPNNYFYELLPSYEQEDAPCYIWHRKPDEDNVPARRKRRLIYAFLEQSLLQATLSGLYFHSTSHSKLNETFCYVEITDFDMGLKDSLDKRDDIALRIDNALRSSQLGCIFGVGSGIDSCYVDLALRNVEKAIPILREIATEKNLPETSWLFFYDSNLQDEWVGLHKSTKAPPVVEEEPLEFEPG